MLVAPLVAQYSLDSLVPEHYRLRRRTGLNTYRGPEHSRDREPVSSASRDNSLAVCTCCSSANRCARVRHSA